MVYETTDISVVKERTLYACFMSESGSVTIFYFIFYF